MVRIMQRIVLNKYIVADPEICGGQPTFKGTRIMVWQVLELLAAGVAIEEILRDYFPHLKRAAILGAIDYAAKNIEPERYALFPEKAPRTKVTLR